MKKTLFLIALAFATISTTFAQQLQDVTLVYEITDVKADDANMAMQLEMMKGSKTTITLQGKKTATSSDMMGGMVKINVLANEESDNMDLTVDAMGQKFWVNSKLSDDKKDPKKAAALESSSVTYNKDKKKTIAGYECYEATLSNTAAPEMKIVMYVSEAIKPTSAMLQGFQGIALSGCPLEISTTNAMFTLVMSAKEVKKTVDASAFNIKTDGFKKMTMEEFQKSMGGFGF